MLELAITDQPLGCRRETVYLPRVRRVMSKLVPLSTRVFAKWTVNLPHVHQSHAARELGAQLASEKKREREMRTFREFTAHRLYILTQLGVIFKRNGERQARRKAHTTRTLDHESVKSK